jgi:16S rRNA (cytosine967-C5)-methyltransferase
MSIDDLLSEPGVEPGRLSPLAATLIDGVPDALSCIRDGRAGVQDEGSQLVALALARAEGGNLDWLDMCSGPGGKAAILSGIALERGGSLVCVEPHPHRARLVEHAVSGTVTVVVGDAQVRPWGERLFDRVLVDAPCTGIGALRRRPESRWRRTAADLAALGPLQRDLLSTALAVTRPGGVVAYVTCSPHLSETEFVVRDVLRSHDGVTLEDARALLPEVSDCGDGPFVQLWPHRHGTDGMFLAVLRQPT